MKLVTGMLATAVLVLVAGRVMAVEEQHVVVHLKTGAKLEGILRSGLEDLRSGSFRPAGKDGDPDSGYRIWYFSGTNGFIFVRQGDIVRIDEQGPVSDEQRRQLEDALKQLRKAAEDSRSRAREELAALEQRQKGEQAEEEATVEEAADEEVRREVDETVRRRQDLLDRFPPSEWQPERRERIKENQVILGLAPSPRETEWLETYDLWKKAYDVWYRENSASEARTAGETDGGGESTKPDRAAASGR